MPTAFSDIDYRMIESFKTHFEEFSKSLVAYLANVLLQTAPPDWRSSSRQKLTRITMHHFHELSTDAYDELMRRQYGSTVPFLLSRDDFHPRRNQFRQELSTLPINRFHDLASDVLHELSRRYPEFHEDMYANQCAA
ncbi:hypothetical protein CPB85DRAFT_1430693 [Mucidula mucida]|nr:hypothetical protein CPB85DRAFT_1430693 [Mucidula mucida]